MEFLVAEGLKLSFPKPGQLFLPGLAAFQGLKLWFLVHHRSCAGLKRLGGLDLIIQGECHLCWREVIESKLSVSWVICSISLVVVVPLHLFAVQVSPLPLASPWILPEASAVRHRLGRIFLAPNSSPRSRKCLSVKRIHMENTCFQALCTHSKNLVWLRFYFCCFPGMSLLLLSRQHLCIAFPFPSLDFINIFVVFKC